MTKFEKYYNLGLFAFLSISGSVTFVQSCNDSKVVIPGKGLEKTLLVMANDALREHGRSERVTGLSEMSCRNSQMTRSDIRGTIYHDCTAEARFADGSTWEICIYRDFSRVHRHGRKGRSVIDTVYMTVNMCGIDSNVEITREFPFSENFYDIDGEVTE